MTRFRAVPALALALMLAPALTRPAQAQIDRVYEPASEAHAAGRLSLQFRIIESFQLASFSGSGLSITKNTSPQGAWELGFTYDAQTTDRSLVQDILGSVQPPLDAESQVDGATVALALLRLHRYHPDRRVGLMFGAGPFVSYQHFHTETDELQPTVTRHLEATSTGYGFGVDAALGAEVFVAPAISLHARYEGSLGYFHVSDSQEDTSVDTSGGPAVQSTVTREDTQHRWSLSGQGVRFGLSVYF